MPSQFLVCKKRIISQVGSNFVINVFRNAVRVVRKTNPSLRTVHKWVFWCCWGHSFGLVLCSFHRINNDMVLVNVRTTYWLCFVLRQSFYWSYRRSVFFSTVSLLTIFWVIRREFILLQGIALQWSGLDGLVESGGHTPLSYPIFPFCLRKFMDMIWPISISNEAQLFC